MLTVFMYASWYGLNRYASGGTVGGVVEMCGHLESYFGKFVIMCDGGVESVVS